MTDDEARVEIVKLGYSCPKKLVTGEWGAICNQIFTTGLFVIVADLSMWRTRYCYEHMKDAALALSSWNGVGDPPGPWIKRKPEDILGPGALT